MPTAQGKLPLRATMAGFRRFSVAEYHKLINLGILTENDDLELLDGYLVEKMPHNPVHDGTLQKVNRRFLRVLPAGWEARVQMAITLSASEPEPDLAVVRESVDGYMGRHPEPTDFGILVEVSNTSLDSDRDDKIPIYARDGVPVYWIVNLIDRQIEVHEQPSGPSANPSYAKTTVLKPGDSVPVILGGVAVGTIPVADLLP
ncbi:MAG: Uma2 family endonuclease [Planctomycetaceae bacterium]|nr:Uma2 family endonuclease [Planctomycetaceae bacterium]